MDLKNILQIGEKIEIRYNEENSDNWKKGYSMIQDVKDESDIAISLPIIGGVPILLEFGQEIEIDFYRDEGCFTFKARVIEQFKSSNLSLVKVAQISPVERLQRRNYFRLKITLPVYLRILTGSSEGNTDSWHKAYILDISGGGIRISFRRKINEDSLVQCKFNLNQDQIKVMGKVVRCQLIEDNPNTKYEIGLAFIDISEHYRDLIIKFIFEEQRKLRQKGLI